jgi:hypothetical protein
MLFGMKPIYDLDGVEILEDRFKSNAPSKKPIQRLKSA